MVLHFRPLGEGGARLAPQGAGIALQGDLENLGGLGDGLVHCGSEGLAWREVTCMLSKFIACLSIGYHMYVTCKWHASHIISHRIVTCMVT